MSSYEIQCRRSYPVPEHGEILRTTLARVPFSRKDAGLSPPVRAGQHVFVVSSYQTGHCEIYPAQEQIFKDSREISALGGMGLRPQWLFLRGYFFPCRLLQASMEHVPT